MHEATNLLDHARTSTALAFTKASRTAKKPLAAGGDAVRHWPRAVRMLIAGGISGSTAKTATAPLELVRVNLMVGAKAAGAVHRATLGEVVSTTFKSGGVGAFWKGNGVNVMRTIPSKGIQFAAFDAFKRLLVQTDKKTGVKSLPAWGSAVAGAAAGVVSTTCCHPLETLQTRLAVGHYKNAVDCVAAVVRTEGPAALFGGLGPSLAGIVPFAALNLGAYDALRTVYKKARGTEKVPKSVAVCIGVASGAVAATATFPLEVLRRRQMMGAAVSHNVLVALVAIAEKEGVQALFAGAGLNLLKMVPSSAVGIWSYEAAKELLDVSGPAA